MKKIFSVLVVAFFLAATFVLVPQNNYLAFAQENQEEEQLGDDFVDKNNIKTRLPGQTTPRCNSNNTCTDPCLRCDLASRQCVTRCSRGIQGCFLITNRAGTQSATCLANCVLSRSCPANFPICRNGYCWPY